MTLHRALWWQQQNISQTSKSQHTPHTSPSGVSYELSIFRSLEKIVYVVTAPNCSMFQVHNSYQDVFFVWTSIGIQYLCDWLDLIMFLIKLITEESHHSHLPYFAIHLNVGKIIHAEKLFDEFRFCGTTSLENMYNCPTYNLGMLMFYDVYFCTWKTNTEPNSNVFYDM